MNINDDYVKVINTLDSCINNAQLAVGANMVNGFLKTYKIVICNGFGYTPSKYQYLAEHLIKNLERKGLTTTVKHILTDKGYIACSKLVLDN